MQIAGMQVYRLARAWLSLTKGEACQHWTPSKVLGKRRTDLEPSFGCRGSSSSAAQKIAAAIGTWQSRLPNEYMSPAQLLHEPFLTVLLIHLPLLMVYYLPISLLLTRRSFLP